MEPSTINYKFKRGDTKKLNKFNITDKEGQAITLTENDNIYFTMKLKNSDTAILKKSIGNGIELGSDGYYHITIEPEDTEDLEVSKDKKYVYDIELNLSINNKLFVQTLFEGKIILLKDITLEGDRSND